jgi:hypothetical protein
MAVFCICTSLLSGAFLQVKNDVVNYIGIALVVVTVISGVIAIREEIKKKRSSKNPHLPISVK